MKESKFYQEILQEGRLEGHRQDLLVVLEIRFGSPSVEITQKLQALNDAEQMWELYRLAVRCRRLSVFERALDRCVAKVK